jgi:hypothetical protein
MKKMGLELVDDRVPRYQYLSGDYLMHLLLVGWYCQAYSVIQQ